MSSWISLDRKKSPVQASVGLHKELAEQKKEAGENPDTVVSLSIGAESEQPAGAIGERLKGSYVCSPIYNNAVGADDPVRETIADYVYRMFGISATKDNTFFSQTNSRFGLNVGYHHSAYESLEDGIIPLGPHPDTSWPMVVESAEWQHVKPVFYKVSRHDQSDYIMEAFDRKPSFKRESQKNRPSQHVVNYTNTEHNPTGLTMTRDTMRSLTKGLNERNEDRLRHDSQPVLHLIDSPYYAGCSQKSSGAHLDHACEGNIDFNGPTPTVISISFAKAYGMARPGASAFIVSHRLAPIFREALSRENGFSYMPEFAENLRWILGPDNDKAALEHFDSLRQKYTVNRVLAHSFLGDYLTIVDGDPNMTCLFEVPDNLLGRGVMCSDGQIRPINDVNDLVEYLANEMGVVIVNNSTGGRNLIRIALREQPAVMERAFTYLANGLTRVVNSPKGIRLESGAGIAIGAAPA